MSQQLLYLTPYLLALLVLGGIFLYAVRRRYIRGAAPFACIVAGQALTTAGLCMELLSSPLESKLLWESLQWLTGGFLVTLPMLIFALRFSAENPRHVPLFLGLALTFLGLFATFLLTDHIHHLFYQDARLVAGNLFPELQYDFTPALLVYLLLYGYGAHVFAVILLARRALAPYNPLRLQDLAVTAGFLLPLLASLFALIGVHLLPQRDTTPLASALGSLLAAWGLFRYGLFDITAIAREQIFSELPEPVILLDPRNRIVDLNPAALVFVEMGLADVIGRTPDVGFSRWPSIREVIENPFFQKTEISTTKGERPFLFEIQISPILGHKRELIGRIVVVRDITKLRTIDSSYQASLREVQERLQKETQELQATAERYRSILEQHSDFIVRWKPDGARTFVNEAYCRYWNITQEQALARNFLFHHSGEDRTDIEARIASLDSGAAELEPAAYRVTRADGTLAWQEWTDKAIRDEWGKLIEIQSIGRDVTERKQKEDRPTP